MSDQNGDNGSKDRATVALAVEKIESLHQLTRAEFGDVKERIAKLEGLPERVTRLEERPPGTPEHVARLEVRVSALESAGTYMRSNMPPLVVSILAVAVAAAALFL